MAVSAASFIPAALQMREHTGDAFSRCAAAVIINPLIVRRSLGRLGRVEASRYAGASLKSGLLGRLGRLFQTHSGTEGTNTGNEARMIDKLNDFGRSVPGVPSTPAVELHRSLSERERAILIAAGAVNDSIIIEALRLFDARVVE